MGTPASRFHAAPAAVTASARRLRIPVGEVGTAQPGALVSTGDRTWSWVPYAGARVCWPARGHDAVVVKRRGGVRDRGQGRCLLVSTGPRLRLVPTRRPGSLCVYGLLFVNGQHHACQTLGRRHPGARGTGGYSK